MQIQTKTIITENQTTTIDTITIKTIDTIKVAIIKTTDITKNAVHQTSIKTETTQTDNQVDIVTEQITSPGIVKLVLTAEDWDMYLANVEHHDKIRTIGNKIRMVTKTREIRTTAATQIPFSNKLH